ncbi:amidase [Xylariaceae sp. AK1471]|nr:amidase [Xylariaceae sp. AK1471]
MEVKHDWEDIVNRKRQIQRDLVSLHVNDGARTASRGDANSPTNVTAISELVSKLSRGELSCEGVMKAYISRACEAHKITNCLTEILFDDALRRAKELDDYLLENGRPIGPLRGIPVTLKDQFDITGFDSTIGYVSRSFRPATRDSALVEMLQSLGAIVMAKTNLPQSIMWCETDNPLWGLTTNPLHSGYTPGGSSGGEAALLASGGSLLGWGTDIGGSIRIPSHMMGLYGFKPSSARLPYRGVPVSTEGQEHVPSSVGPMARSLDAIHNVFKSLIELKPWNFDARCAAIPWREDVYQATTRRPLVIGVLFDDEVVRPHPPVTRVLRSAVEALQAAGHHVVDWDASLHADCVQVLDQFYTADGGEDIREAVKAGGEPFIQHVKKLIDCGSPLSVLEYWQLNKRKWELQQKYLDKWNSIRSAQGDQPVDVVIMPPMPHTSVPHGSCRWVGYTKVWNVLDYPAIVIPGGTVCDRDICDTWSFEPHSVLDEWNKDLWENNKEFMASLRLPVGIQIIGRRYDEEKVLAAAKVLDDILHLST